jgi:hypothetical protein
LTLLPNKIRLGATNDTALFNAALAPTAFIKLNGCNTGRSPSGDGTGQDSAVHYMSRHLPGRTIQGNGCTVYRISGYRATNPLGFVTVYRDGAPVN